MYLLEGDVGRGKIVVVDGVLVQGVHGRVGARAALVQSLLRHDPLPGLGLAVLQDLTVVCADLEVRRDAAIDPLAVVLVCQRIALTRRSICDQT